MSNYATIEDIETLYRPLTESERVKANALIPVVCDRLRIEADNVGQDLDKMIENDPRLANVAKSVTVDVVARNLMTPTKGAPMTQFSESGLGYTQSGTFLIPGGGVFIKNSELDALGLTRPKYGFWDMCGGETDD